MDEEIEEMEQRPPSARRTFTIRNNAARQMAVNFMPSRQLPYSTLRLRRNNSEHNGLLDEASEGPEAPDAVDKQAEIIVREMEQHQRLMEDNPVAEELRREALRDLPQGLTMKRNVRAKLSASVSLRSKRKPISFFKRMKYRISFAFKRIYERLRNFIFSIELWYEAIRNVEGHFGSAVGSYFYFLRWLFVINLLITTIVVAFIVIPQALHDEEREPISIGFLDFISGKGGMEDSMLFYGHYHDGDISSRGNLTYSMPYAYFFTMICVYVVFFGMLCYRTAYSYRLNFIETSGGLSHIFASKVFCGWDFGIVSLQAAALNANSLYNEFKELLSEQNKKQVTTSACIKLAQHLTNIIVTLLVLALILGVEYGLWLLVGMSTRLPHWELILSIAITAVVAICPVFFHFIVKLEYYRPRTALYVTIARTWLLDVGTLILLLVYWSRSNTQCWETSFGQETYRLVLLDTVISLFVLPMFEFTRAFVYKFNPSGSAPEFNIAYNSLTLIYNQAVLWFGMLFSPLLVVSVTLKFLVLFYVKRECALRACQPATKVWRAAQTQTILYMFVTLSMFTTLFGVGSLFFKASSHSCGPFRQYEYVYSVLSHLLRLHENSTARAVLTFLVRPGVIGFVLLALCVVVYYMRAKALAQRSMVEILRHMLVLQAKDKDFLLNAISKVSNGEWLYSPKPTDEEPETHTWKYLREVRKPSNSGFHFDASRLSHSLIEGRPRSIAKENRSSVMEKQMEDGDTDSSFSWQGSNNYLNKTTEGDKQWI